MKGLELKEVLTARGVVMSELASKLGVTPTTLFNKFNVKIVKPDFIKKVEEIVGFSIEESLAKQDENSGYGVKVDDLIGIILRKDEQIAKRDEQIDRLITLLEKRDGIIPAREKRNAV